MRKVEKYGLSGGFEEKKREERKNQEKKGLAYDSGKMKRTVIASVVAATLLVVCLLAVIIYQVVSISVANKRIERIKAENAELQQTIDRQSGDLDYYLSLLGKEELARRQGYKKP